MRVLYKQTVAASKNNVVRVITTATTMRLQSVLSGMVYLVSERDFVKYYSPLKRKKIKPKKQPDKK